MSALPKENVSGPSAEALPVWKGRRLRVIHVKKRMGHGNLKDTIVLAPGPGFGSGRHPTTRCCLCLMETFFQNHRPVRVLDAGCGSGILSIAAALLGARKVFGIDLREEVVDAARRNVRWSNVQDVASISCEDVREVRGNYDLVMANLDPDVAVDAGKSLVKRLISGGYLVLSGLAGFETDRALKRFVADQRLILEEHAVQRGWSTLLLCRQGFERHIRSSDS